MKIEFEREEDDRWFAEVLDLSGAMAYGRTKEEALALRILADRVEHGESIVKGKNYL